MNWGSPDMWQKVYSLRNVIFFTIAIAFPLGCYAEDRDSLLLNDGDRISGVLLEITPNHVVLSTSHSGVVKVVRSSLVRLETSRTVSVLLASGERVIGRISFQEDGSVRIASSSLGNHTIALSQIVAIKPENKAADAGFATSLTGQEKQDPPPSAVALSSELLAGVRGTGADATSTSRAALHEAESVAGDKPIGQQPADEEDIRKLFLRQSSVLLLPGRYEVEGGIVYQRTRVDSAVFNTLYRGLSVPLSLRVGLADRWQGFVNLPLNYGYQQFSFGDDEASFHNAGVGDISAGLNYQLLHEGDGWSDLVASAGFSAPTGRSPYADNGVGVALGSGHWSSNMGLQFIKTEDPVAIFGGLNYTYQFARNGLGKRVKPGDYIGYNLGLSFAINDRVSVSGEFIGGVQGKTQQDGKLLAGTSREPMQFRTGMIYRASKDWYLAPTLTNSLNSDAPDVAIGVSTSHRFQ